MINVQVWSGSRTAVIIDMEHAGKIGKTCRRLYVDGIAYHADRLGCDWTGRILHYIEALTERDTYNYAKEVVQTLIESAELEGVRGLTMREDTIKGIHAPRPVLTAGVDGKWAASADVHGISLRQLDDINQWSEITPSSQSAPQAYKIAANVWANVRAASTLREASSILSAAGARLHGYCGLD